MSPAPVKVLYHGSAELFDKIDVNKGRPRKDFGKGFYMSVLKKQAEGVMRKKYTETLNRRPNRSKEGLVKAVYSITRDFTMESSETGGPRPRSARPLRHYIPSVLAYSGSCLNRRLLKSW